MDIPLLNSKPRDFLSQLRKVYPTGLQPAIDGRLDIRRQTPLENSKPRDFQTQLRKVYPTGLQSAIDDGRLTFRPHNFVVPLEPQNHKNRTLGRGTSWLLE